MSDPQLEQLKQKVQYLMDRQAILDCVARHAHGHDRHDSDVIASTYWPDGIDEHGKVLNKGPEYAKWANETHAANFKLHTHNITTHLCEIDGDTAHAESYVIVGLLNKDDKTAQYISGRYIDRLEKRNGEWKLLIRRSTVDVMVVGDASALASPVFKEMGYMRGTWDKNDLSYARPLTLDTPAPKW
jgi:hypothetical protein